MEGHSRLALDGVPRLRRRRDRSGRAHRVGRTRRDGDGHEPGCPLQATGLSVLVKSDDNTDTLLIRWRAGSRQAGDRLLGRYVQRLTAFFRKRLGSDADELVQRTLLACAQSLGNFESRS